MIEITQKIIRYIKKPILPKTNIYFVCAAFVAVCYLINPYIYFIAGVCVLFIFLPKPINFIFIFLFIIINSLSYKFFIVAESYNYKNYTYVKTPTAKLYLEKGLTLHTGQLLKGDFKRDQSKSKFFFKPSYVANSSIKAYKIPLVSKILSFRKSMSQKMFYDSGGRVSTAQALIFADKSFIPENLKDSYTISGLAHLLAMSGTHVGIIVAIFLTVLFFLPLKLRMIFAIFGVLLITLFGVFTITVVRAALFSIIFMATYIIDIRTDAKKFLLFMMGIFMIFSPLIIMDISFLLSFGAVYGIIYFIKSGKNLFTAGIITGIAATLITAPLSMYVFGMTNHLSVFSTMLLAPVIYLHILFSLLYLLFPTICLPPLILIEHISNSMAVFFASTTYFGFILKTIPLPLLIFCIIYTIACLASKYKTLSLAVLLVIFYPAPKPPDIIFPALTGANKGFLTFQNGKSNIFYQGNSSGFKFAFLPLAAKYGIKTFDYGHIKIFNGENNYIRIKNIGKEFPNICINEKTDGCRFLYHTRSNSVSKKDIDNETIHIIYKNKFEDESVFILSNTGDIIINKGEIISNAKDKRK